MLDRQCGSRSQPDDRGFNFRRGLERARGDREQILSLSQKLAFDRKISILPATGLRRNPFGDFLLNQKYATVQRARRAHVAGNDRRGDIVGQIAHQDAFAPLRPIQIQSIRFNGFNPRIATPAFAEVRSEKCIKFNRNDSFGVSQQMFGQGTPAGSDFDR